MLRNIGQIFRWAVSAPATSTSPGNRGDIFVDNVGGWIYFCYGTNLWQRASISSF